MRRTAKERPAEDLEGFARSVRVNLGIDDQLRPDIFRVIEKSVERGYIASFAAVADQRMPNAEARFRSGTRRLELRESVLSALKAGDARARWTVAHELAHAVLGHPGTNHRSTRDKTTRRDYISEREANRFAAALLAPKHLIEPSADITVEKIVRRFNISGAAARLRLRELGHRSLGASAKQLADPLPTAQSGEEIYEGLRASLEESHFGSYVMINLATHEHIIDRKMSAVHEKFITKFGQDAPGWSTRIGISAFATA